MNIKVSRSLKQELRWNLNNCCLRICKVMFVQFNFLLLELFKRPPCRQILAFGKLMMSKGEVDYKDVAQMSEIFLQEIFFLTKNGIRCFFPLKMKMKMTVRDLSQLRVKLKPFGQCDWSSYICSISAIHRIWDGQMIVVERFDCLRNDFLKIESMRRLGI